MLRGSWCRGNIGCSEPDLLGEPTVKKLNVMLGVGAVLTAAATWAATAVLQSVAQAQPAQAGDIGFAGSWLTTYGEMVLVVDGDRVTGRYELGGGSSIEGTVRDGVLRFRYAEPSLDKGFGEFRLAPDGMAFFGKWRIDGMGDGPLSSQDQSWYGIRTTTPRGSAAPDPGPWLVILEPHWEQSLRDSEYSFGEMLRNYYRRLPHLQVRHRRIHDRADFVRVGREIGGIEGDVFLYIASHGTQAGATLSDGNIDASLMADLLSSCSNVQLVHFGSCLVAGGTVPEDILRRLAPERRVPISGFKETADWGGSAVVDFAYFDNLFERQMPPKDAVEATRRNVLFAGDAAPGPVAPMGLRIVMPSDVQVESGVMQGPGVR